MHRSAARQLAGVGGAGFRLGLGFEHLDIRQDFGERASAEDGEIPLQPSAGGGRLNGEFCASIHGARIQTCVHLHDADTRGPIAGEDGPLDRGSTPPAGQQGGMNVDAAESRRVKNVGGQQQPIGRNDQHIQGIDLQVLGLQGRRLPNLDSRIPPAA